MTFETNPNEGTYTVQAMIGEHGLRTTSLTDLFVLNRDFTDSVRAKDDWLRNMDYRRQALRVLSVWRDAGLHCRGACGAPRLARRQRAVRDQLSGRA